MINQSNNMPSIHAEQHALTKLPYVRNKKKLEAINLLVIRVSTKNKIQSSKPCAKCIEQMKFLPQKKGYILKHIYYSDENMNIVKTDLDNLDKSTKHYSKYDRRFRPLNK